MDKQIFNTQSFINVTNCCVYNKVGQFIKFNARNLILKLEWWHISSFMETLD